MKKSSLEKKAEQFESLVERSLVERNGLVLSWIDVETMRPFAPGFFTPEMDVMRHPGANWTDFGLYFAYENAGMCTGAWLAAMVWKYRVTRDQAALGRARRTFDAIASLYDASQAVEPGFFSKFHEGKVTSEMSTDQCLYAMLGLDRFLDFASAAEAAKIREIIGGIAGMWIRKGYKHPYRDRDFPWPWPPNRFPVFCWLAWRHTGEARFREEFDRLRALTEVRERAPFISMTRAMAPARLAAFPPAERAKGRLPWGEAPEHTASAQASLDPMLEYDAPDRDLWVRQLRDAYEVGVVGLGEDLLQRGSFSVELATGRIFEVEKPFYSGGKPNPVWRNKGFAANTRSGHSPCMFARAALTIDLYHPDLGAAAKARAILESAEARTMLYKMDPLNHLPPDQKWLTRAFCGDAVVNWLWAWWMGKGRGQL